MNGLGDDRRKAPYYYRAGEAMIRVTNNISLGEDEIEEQLSANNIPVLRACTMVMLRTGQF